MFYMLGRKAPQDIPQYIANCNVAFVSFTDNALFAKTIPAKLQSYMACGIPVLASATGETKRIVEEAYCGMACRLGDSDALAAGILRFMEMSEEEISRMGQNALNYSKTFFGKKFLMDEMEEYLEN